MKKKRALSDSRSAGNDWEGSLEDYMAHTMAKEIQQEIDRGILWSILEADGWVRVSLDRFQDNHHAIDIREWIEQSCQGNYITSGSDFIFEEAKDATMFILRWS